MNNHANADHGTSAAAAPTTFQTTGDANPSERRLTPTAFTTGRSRFTAPDEPPPTCQAPAYSTFSHTCIAQSSNPTMPMWVPHPDQQNELN
jgi:hypothetical protein